MNDVAPRSTERDTSDIDGVMLSAAKHDRDIRARRYSTAERRS